MPLTVVEAKRTKRDTAAGIEQAKRYAQRLELPVAYATNAHAVWEIEIGGAIRQRPDFPSPEESGGGVTRYRDATALRRALEARLKQESEGTSGDLGRLRRCVVFDRLAVRLSVDGATRWILKGGVALKFRLGGRARATKDLDLAVTNGVADGLAVRELLIDALSEDADGDWFSFRVAEPVALAVDGGNRLAWRFSVEASTAHDDASGREH